jgi:hypothetical protein
MRIRFQADADLNQVIVSGLLRRFPDVDFQTATQAGLAGRQDPEVLLLAASEGRVLVTHDKQTMPRHFGEFAAKAKARSPGLIVVPQHLAVADAIEDLAVIWSASQSEEWINRLVYLPL